MKYRTIVADPPWTMPSGGPYKGTARYRSAPSTLPYETMSMEQIRRLPVASLAGEDAHLYLWVPNAHLEAGYSIARDWGFRPSQVLVWTKTPRGLGLGGAFTNTTEFVLFCRRGSLPPLNRQQTTWFHFKRPHNVHSAKPEGFLDVVEQVSPGPYVELFARRARFGWDYWGDQSLGTAEMEAA
jgi:N6-adenosine-specific RNA methylase IME4